MIFVSMLDLAPTTNYFDLLSLIVHRVVCFINDIVWFTEFSLVAAVPFLF